MTSVEGRKLNPLPLAADKFQLQKMHPIVGDHLLFSDRKRIITSLRGRRTDMPFRLGHECRSVIGSLRNNFALCLSFTFRSRAGFVREDSAMTVWGSALSQGRCHCKHGPAASISSSARKEKEKPPNAFNFHLAFFDVPAPLPRTDRCHSLEVSAHKLFVFRPCPTCVQPDAK